MPARPRPVKDVREVPALCQHLVPGTIPDLLMVDVPSWAEPDQRTENVTKFVGERGGEIVYGWKLVELLPGLMIEAEFLPSTAAHLEVLRHSSPEVPQTPRIGSNRRLFW